MDSRPSIIPIVKDIPFPRVQWEFCIPGIWPKSGIYTLWSRIEPLIGWLASVTAFLDEWPIQMCFLDPQGLAWFPFLPNFQSKV